MRASILLVLLLTGCQQSPSVRCPDPTRHALRRQRQPAACWGHRDQLVTRLRRSETWQARWEQRRSTHAVSRWRLDLSICSAGRLSRWIVDGRSQSDIRQGVTLEVMGEGESMRPLNERMKAENVTLRATSNTPIEWTTLDQYCVTSRSAVYQRMWRRLLAQQCKRVHELGYANRLPQFRRDGSHEGSRSCRLSKKGHSVLDHH